MDPGKDSDYGDRLFAVFIAIAQERAEALLKGVKGEPQERD